MKRALIFGISGQDGAYLAQLLLDKGYHVVGTSRDAELSSFGNLTRLGIREQVTCLSAAINDFRSTLSAITQAEPDEIYNLAGQSSVGLSFQQPAETHESINVGTLNLLEVLRFIGGKPRFYNASSSECFGDTGDHPANENTPFRPRSPYAVAKASAFWQVANYREAYHLFVCSGILFNHESPLRPPRFVTRKIISTAVRIAAGSGETLQIGNIDIVRDWGWAPEYVDAMWRMLQQEYAEDYVIATGRSSSLREFIASVFAQLGCDWERHTQVDPTLFRPTDIRVSRANPTKAYQRLHWCAEKDLNAITRAMIEAEAR
ncbi:GDP-mannose 4,6-dehydratase [Rhodopseudomonas palustris]|uniref:GDP-mannose 4,6-dehydratase n=1 Tax=Thiospirillum jenense TaxID=1653858 RepID=A0A839HDX2_9GAMM|nr:GDP-mannose 4,6-dehydratase [Thiospirillum jenense]MBB1091962.1 GDP-mannose 4,6-dehydratase [Rhodopseudomonas palustris]MBB1126320.1 GDP-mannose 4,6-dehydratase [Thiospirillum jenense]